MNNIYKMAHTNCIKKFEENDDYFYQKVLEGFGGETDDNNLVVKEYMEFLERKTNNKKHTDLDKILKKLHNPKEIEKFIKKNEKILSDEDEAYLRAEELKSSKTTKEMHSKNGKYSSARRTVHNMIIKRLLNKGAKEKEPVVIFMAGLGGSGKGSIKGPILKGMGLSNKIINVDPDEIKYMLPDYKKIKGVLRAAKTHEESSDIAKKVVTMAVNQKYNLIIDGTMKNMSRTKKILMEAKKKGYRTIMRATQLPTHKAMERNVARYKGAKNKDDARLVPLEIIEKMGKDVNKSIHALKHTFDDYRVYDTDVPMGDKPILIEKGKKAN